jgi:hypothetical protein
MLTPMNRAGGLPANLELRMADEGRLVARHVPFPLAHGWITAVDLVPDSWTFLKL